MVNNGKVYVNDPTKKVFCPDRWNINATLNTTQKNSTWHGLGDPLDGLHDQPMKELTETLKENHLLYQGPRYKEVCNIKGPM